ncbi:MAG: hypothetical protein OXF51_07865, partial [Alphaproteobacteria bacterium]|nr:hypothetical protein [Alphaproteobacteria bacterium]
MALPRFIKLLQIFPILVACGEAPKIFLSFFEILQRLCEIPTADLQGGEFLVKLVDPVDQLLVCAA